MSKRAAKVLWSGKGQKSSLPPFKKGLYPHTREGQRRELPMERKENGVTKTQLAKGGGKKTGGKPYGELSKRGTLDFGIEHKRQKHKTVTENETKEKTTKRRTCQKTPHNKSFERENQNQ